MITLYSNSAELLWLSSFAHVNIYGDDHVKLFLSSSISLCDGLHLKQSENVVPMLNSSFFFFLLILAGSDNEVTLGRRCCWICRSVGRFGNDRIESPGFHTLGMEFLRP